MEEILFFFIQVVEYGSIILQEALVNDIEPIRLDIELVDHLESARLWLLRREMRFRKGMTGTASLRQGQQNPALACAMAGKGSL